MAITKKLRQLVYAVWAPLLALHMAHADTTNSSRPQSAPTRHQGSSAGNTQNENLPKTNWTFQSQKDEMRDTLTYFSAIKSDNTLDFGFPYGRSQATFVLRRTCCTKKIWDDARTDVILTANGQFMCSAFGGSKISVKFDASPIKSYRCHPSSDGRTGAVFIDGGTFAIDFYKNLLRASRMIIEAEFYQHGRQQFTFSVAGFKKFNDSVPLWPEDQQKKMQLGRPSGSKTGRKD